MASMTIKNQQLIFASCIAISCWNKELLELTQSNFISYLAIYTNFNPLVTW